MRFRKKFMKTLKKSFETNSKSKFYFMVRSERKMNEDFGKNIKAIVQKMIDTYNQETTGYIEEEVEKIRLDFFEFLERKIELSFSYQVRMISEECLK